MPDSAQNTLEEPAAHRPPESSVSCAALLAVATPALYAGNPFRRIGLPVLAGAREVLRRIDELKLSVELGNVVLAWAFAPESGLTQNEIREAAQKLKIPRDRLIHELFWFWPESYPEDSADEALAFLARGEKSDAVQLWQTRAREGSRAARHNLAIYHHVLALDTEHANDGETRPAQIWLRAVDEWQRLAGDESFWSLVRGRVQKLADPQLPESFVDELRASLPVALSQINSNLLVSHAERSRPERAGLHASLIGLIHRDLPSVRRTLDACAIPIARRIDTYVAAAREAAPDETAQPLAIAATLLRNCDDDLRLVKTLCAGEEAYTELSNSVADTALSCVVAHQRRTQDDRSCLLLLLYVLNLDVTPELRRRLDETYQVIRTNVLVTDHDADAPTAIYERDHRLITEAIIPQLDTLQLSPHGQKEFASRIADWLGQLAVTAWRDHNRLDFAELALTSALELHCNRATRARLEQEWSQLQAELHGSPTEPFALDRNGHRFAIDAEEIRLGDQRLALAEVTGLRWSQSAADGGLTIAWCSTDTAMVLDATNLLAGDDAMADSAAILEALHRFLVPQVVLRLVDAIRSGATILLGETAFAAEGVQLEPAGKPVPYARVRHRSDPGSLVVSDSGNPDIAQHYNLTQVWNAAIFGQVIDALARNENPVSA